MIPSQMKKINESLAKEILQYYSDKYANIICSEKPDLRDDAVSLGIEVTTDFPDKEGWKRILKDENIIKCLKDLEKMEIVPRTTYDTKKIIKQKLGKKYCGIKYLELFIFMENISYPKELLLELIEYWLNEQETSQAKYDRIFLYSAVTDTLWDCEAETKKWLLKKFPCGFSRSFLYKFVSEDKLDSE